MDALAFADELMGHQDPVILARGVRVLGTLGDPRTIGLLVRFSQSSDFELRAAAIGALEAIQARAETRGLQSPSATSAHATPP
ncbi:MAG: HEAT repeat domain-containing protein [Myxococcota bacterium]